MDFRIHVVQCCDTCNHLEADKKHRVGKCKLHNVAVHKLNTCDNYSTDGVKVNRIIKSIPSREVDLFE